MATCRATCVSSSTSSGVNVLHAWKHADRDLPVLLEAEHEHHRLQERDVRAES
jgi:hypothetical protein